MLTIFSLSYVSSCESYLIMHDAPCNSYAPMFEETPASDRNLERNAKL